MKLDDYLSEHFQLKEFLVGEKTKTHFLELTEKNKSIIIMKLKLLANELEVDRNRYNKPLIITSGVRFGDPRFHGKYMAADFYIPDISNIIIKQDNKDFKGGLGYYNKHIHKDIRHLFGFELNARWSGVSR